MTLRLSAPSKTFLIGEYAVLRGGPALILNTEPRFELQARQVKVDSSTEGTVGRNTPARYDVRSLSPQSPAAKWLELRAPLLNGWQIDFIDPHAGRGGFGASSAQFLLVHALTTFLQSSVGRAVQGYDQQALWNDFRVLTGERASGADVVGQTVGQVAFLHMEPIAAEARGWPFADLGFAIVRTQNKLNTHEHLAALEPERLATLPSIAALGLESFHMGLTDTFVKVIREYAGELRKLDLQSAASQDMTDRLQKKEWCRAAKGCGAMGADTVLVLFASVDRDRALRDLEADGCEVISTDAQVSPGLEMKWSWNED